MLCFVHKEKTPCKLLSYKELHKAYRTRSGSQELNPYKTLMKYNTLIINIKILRYIVKYCK